MRRRRDNSDILGSMDDDFDEVITSKVSDVYKLAGGVSVQWLARAFRTTRHLVDKKLVGLKPLSVGKHGNPLYDFVEAAELIVEPKVDVEKYLTTLKPEKLPERLREGYWNAKLKRQRWEEKAGDLWRTEVVIERFSEVLLELRMMLQLIPDSVERAAGLSDEQHRVVRSVIDDIQTKMHEQLIKYAADRLTPSQLGEEDEDDDVL